MSGEGELPFGADRVSHGYTRRAGSAPRLISVQPSLRARGPLTDGSRGDSEWLSPNMREVANAARRECMPCGAALATAALLLVDGAQFGAPLCRRNTPRRASVASERAGERVESAQEVRRRTSRVESSRVSKRKLAMQDGRTASSQATTSRVCADLRRCPERGMLTEETPLTPAEPKPF